MSGFKSFSKNITTQANIIKAQINEHSEVAIPKDTQPSQASGTAQDLPEINDLADPNNK